MYAARTGNGFRAAIALEEAGLDYRAYAVDLRRPRDPGYLDLNPTGRIPTIGDHEPEPPIVLTQTVAIVLYAARKSGRLLAALADAPFLAGPEFSLADVVAFPIVSTLAGTDPQRWPLLAGWSALVGARPAVQRGMAILAEAPAADSQTGPTSASQP